MRASILSTFKLVGRSVQPSAPLASTISTIWMPLILMDGLMRVNTKDANSALI